MVFESIITDILNKVLGSYIENLDTKQLRLGIWGGDVVLTNLLLKRSALKDLDLPVQTVYGQLVKLTLKIPWKNIYNAPVEATIDGLYVLVEPNAQVEYDAEKEASKLMTAKQNQLKNMEIARQREIEAKADKKVDATFVEKLTAQIIRNVQVRIKNIHIRYEDKVTNPSYPFAMGITLSELSVQSTDEKFMSTISPTEKLSKIFKMLELHGLSVYWNSKSKLYGDYTPEQLIKQLQDDIATKTKTPEDYTYILGPIHSSTRLKLNPRPDLDSDPFVIPKVMTNWEMEQLAIGISKRQYRDIIGFADSMALMARGEPYRKYRPNVPYKGHYKEWWHFAYNCILEFEVRRKLNNWNWDHMSNHLQMCKQYGVLYKQKLQSKKPIPEIEDELTRLEKNLDVMNILMARQKVKMELEALEKSKPPAAKGWFSSWFSKPAVDDKTGGTADIAAQFQAAMTPDEKQRLYKAIDYHENAAQAVQPAHYVDMVFAFVLQKLEVRIYNKQNNVLLTQFLSVKAKLEMRTSANGVAVHANINEISITGIEQDHYIPTLISCNPSEDGALCDVLFEINPLNSKCTNKLHASVKPIKIIYDALTINGIVDLFTIPRSSTLQQLTDAATSTLDSVKLQSAAGLQHVIDKHTQIDLIIDLHAPYVIIPYGGIYTETENILAINLGHAKFVSVEVGKSTIKEKQLKYTQEDLVNALIEESYDKFALEFSNLQIMVVPGGEDWLSIWKESTRTSYHILNPLSVSLQFYFCLVDYDPRLPRVKIDGVLPCLSLNITDYQLVLLLGLIHSIPVPKVEEISASGDGMPSNTHLRRPSSQTLQFFDFNDKEAQTAIDAKEDTTDVVIHQQYTSLELHFIISELCAILKHQEYSKSPVHDVAKLTLQSLMATVILQTYAQDVRLKLENLNFKKYHHNDEVPIITTPIAKDGDFLFEVRFLKVDKKSPDFGTVYKNCESLLVVNVEVIKVKLHREILMELMQYATELQIQLDELLLPSKSQQIPASKSSIRQVKRSISEALSYSSQTQIAKKSKAVLHGTFSPTILFKLEAKLQEFQVLLGCDLGDFSSLTVNDVKTQVILKEAYTQVSVVMKNINVLDLSPETKYYQILKVLSDEVVNFNLFLYDKQVDTSRREDMAVSVSLGHIRLVFLNLYVSKVLAFINKFQQARQAIIDASKAAADKAKQNVANIYENSVQISINIDIKTPQVIIPEKSNSLYALMCDLGHLTIKNNFLELNIVHESSGNNAIIDEMELKLTDVQLLRIESNEKLEMINKMVLLMPVNLGLLLKRNLSSSWYKSVPDIQINGQIDTIEVVLGQADYGTVMAIVLGNLGEAVQLPPDTTITPYAPESSLKLEHVQSAEIKASATQTLDKPSIKEEDVTIFVKFSFIMNKFTIKLLSVDDVRKEPRSFKLTRKNFAMFSLEGLSLKGRMLSDGAIHTSVLLIDCVIQDTRIEKEDRLNKMFSRAYQYTDLDPASAGYRSMIDVVFQQKQQNTYLDLKVSGFNLILSMEFLSKLQAFLMSAFSEENIGGSVPPSSQPPVRTISAQKSTSTKSSQPVGKASSRTETKPSQNMTINIRLEKPDIVLVEHLNNIDTNALILNCELLMKLRMSDDRQVINGIAKDIQMYTCCYNPAKRDETKHLVVFPFTVNIAGSTPEGKGLHIEVCLTEIRIKISPATIELLNRAYNTMFTIEKDAEKEVETFSNLNNLWDPMPYEDTQFWFFKTELAEDAIELLVNTVTPTSTSEKKQNEMAIVTLPLLIVTVEIGEGKAALPVIILESCFEGSIQNWSTDMAIDSTLTLQLAYYNSTLAVWEPLIEPVGTTVENETIYKPWELKMDVSMNTVEPEVTSPQSDVEVDEPSIVTQPKMSVLFSSSNNLEVTISKTTLEVLMATSNAFSNAVTLTTLKPPERDNAPYKFINHSGLQVKIDCVKSNFNVYQNTDAKEVILKNGAEVALQLKELDKTNYTLSEILGHINVLDKYLYINVIQMNCEIQLNLVRSDTRYFSLKYRDQKDIWGIVTSTLFEESTYKVILSSIIRIYNHLQIPVDIYYMTLKGDELECIGSIQPEGTFYVPIKAVYTPTSELFFSIQNYSVSSKPFVWKDLHLNVNQTQLLQCLPMKSLGHSEPFVIKAISSIEQIYNENTVKRTMNSILCNVHIHSPVLFRNCLPYNIYLTVQNVDEEYLIEPGCTLTVTNATPGVSYIVVRLPNYLDKEWSCVRDILLNPPQFSVWTFDSYDSTVKVSLDLGVHTIGEGGPLMMTLYCPFWMINKSELNIAYRKSKKTEKNESSGSPHKNSDENLNILHHPANFKGPILFSFNAKNFFGKKKAAIKIESGGEWSDKFSIDVAGSSGVITCKHEEKIYQFGVNIELTYNGLTKQVTFTPYYVLINNAPFPIECQEHDRPADPWTAVQPNSCQALWPLGDFDDKLLRMRVVGTKELSPPFYFSDSHNTVLKLANKYGGVYVDTQITEGAVYITFAKYEHGMAPALLINNTRNTLNIWEKDTVHLMKLDPGHKMYYSWSNPSQARVLCWEAGYKKEVENDLRKDGCGDYDIEENNHVYWTSFLDGMQRTLLFTNNEDFARNAQSSQLLEQIDQEITLSIFGVGLSLVNNSLKREVMYIGIANSGIIWEICKHGSNRYKQMGARESAMMESSYRQYMSMKHTEEFTGRMVVDAKTEVNFETMEMLRPNSRKIRRTYLTGLWLQMTTNPYMLQLHAKINRLQIDNQAYDCMFPVVLAPVSLPKSVAGTDVHKPFAELSIVQMLIKHSQIKQFKYFKLLIQEFHINLELGFVTAVSEVFQLSKDTLEKQKASFLLDADLVNQPLFQHVSQQSQQEQKSFYDLLHFSPLKIHVSFSLGSGLQDMTPNVVTVLLSSLGVTLTDMQDVIFRIAYFEREYTFLTQKQLVSEATSHYIGQAVKQLYALVLGLDVLGNPYGLVLGITKGVEDLFYEPFQGAIQGPGEFAEGLALGVRSLFGHTVGGAAGAVSRITGAMGKGIAALTFDKDFQRKRRDAVNKRATTVSEGFARSGKGLVMGVYDGLTGVIRKPISGAKEQGVGGFFKGLGKGAVGLVARPTSGVIDFASSSLDTVKRVTELTAEEVNRLRPSRYIYSDGLIKPYNEREAQGNKILFELEKGKYATTDLYLFHYFIVGKKEILMLTDKRLLYIVYGDIFGFWQAEWSYTWNELSMPPKVVPKGVLVMSAEPKKKKNLFASADVGKTILIQDQRVAEAICQKIIEVHTTHSS